VQPQEDLQENVTPGEECVLEPTALKADLEDIRDTLLELVDLVEDLLDTSIALITASSTKST
jgi:hypothetical protein